MSSLPIDDQLFQETLAVAAAQGKTLDQFVSEAIRGAVRTTPPQSTGVRRSSRNRLPVMVVEDGVPAINPGKVRNLIEENGF